MFSLPGLPYDYDALQPVLSDITMRTHHDRHHARYVAVTNEILSGATDYPDSVEEVVRRARAEGNHKLANNAGQAWNHAFFWDSMSPTGTAPTGSLLTAIEAQDGGLDTLKAKFVADGVAHFGSGWLWLVTKDRSVSVATTHDGATALELDGTPLLVCDLWEHAYYLDYRNDREGFLTAWWDSLANWALAASQFAVISGGGKSWSYPKPAP